MISHELDVVSYWAPGDREKVNSSFFFKVDTWQVGVLSLKNDERSIAWDEQNQQITPAHNYYLGNIWL